VLHVISYLGKNQGGPVFGLAGYVRGLLDCGIDADVLYGVSSTDGELLILPDGVGRQGVTVTPMMGLRWAPGLTTSLAEDIGNYQLVHLHGLWTDVHRRAATVAHRFSVPTVIAPCGMLNPGALRFRGWKKHIVWQWFQEACLRRAAGIHAKSDKERDDIGSVGPSWSSVRVIPNPVGTLTGDPEQRAYTARQRWDLSPRRRYYLFLGRLHPVKGIQRLVEALCRLPANPEPWTLLVAGPDEAGMVTKLSERLASVGRGESVRWLGAVSDIEKWDLLTLSEFLIAPSDMENFGLAIGEALSAGKPVITTTGTPWKAIAAVNAGWYIEPSISALMAAMQEAFACEGSRLTAMGLRGKSLVEPFSVPAVGRQLKDWYEEVLCRSKGL
jgi:glycosyltransferase involved in cell wall biosynthesis